MKKIKIMLTAMILLGTVGGVLAIKAKRSSLYCTASSGSCSTKKCTGGQVGLIDPMSTATPKCYVTTTNTDNCGTANLDCTAQGRIATN